MNPLLSTAAHATAPPVPATNPFSELERLGDEIAELSAHIQAATYRLLVLIGEFDRREGWGSPQCRSCAYWLNWRTGLALGAAREKVRVARALESLPRISEAMSRGEISYSKVRALTRVARPENEEELLHFAGTGTAAHVERVVRAWRRVDRLEEARETKRRHQHRYLTTLTDEDGMLVVHARLEPEAGAALLRALEAATDVLYERSRADAGPGDGAEQETSAEQRRADALGLVAESALTNGLDNGTRGDRYQVVVHVDAPALEDPDEESQSVLEGGPHVPAETTRRLACDCSTVVMRHGADGSVLDVGRKTRTISPALRRALTHRDRDCRYPGCGLRFCDAHHAKHWAEGGETKLGNTLLLCRRHHRAVHEGGFRVELLPSGECRFYWPDGRPLPAAPRQGAVEGDSAETLRQRHEELGLAIHSRTGLPSWWGESLDLRWAVDGLRGAGKPLSQADLS